MKQKTRKLLSRIGAAFMLGMSLFNFGAVWNKQRGGQTPQRAKNIRKKQQEQENQLIQEVAAIAEQEAEKVMLEERIQEQESQQQLQEETMTFFQKFARYAAISVWAFSASIIFSSAVFNYPFALGKGMLSLLPGVPHVASLSLDTQQDYYKVGDKVKVDVLLETNKEEVDLVRLAVKYDPTVLEFSDYEFDQELFDSLEERSINKRKGEMIISFKRAGEGIALSKQEIGAFYFDTIVTAECDIDLIKSQSAVVGHSESVNILGKTNSTQFRVVN